MKEKKGHETNKVQYLPLGMCFGMSIGMAIGAVVDNITVGMCLGLSVGVCIGSIIDYFNNKSGEVSGILNITNGDCFNDHFTKAFDGFAVPFCEAMMDGETITDIYSDEFVDLRSNELGVTKDEYKAKMKVYDALIDNSYSELRLWFGKDTFCQVNLLTLLAYLEQIEYRGKIVLNYIDDETFEILEKDIEVDLGIYRKLYGDILVSRKRPSAFGVLFDKAIDLYFDYHSADGKLLRLIKDNSDKDERALICLLLENSKEYGLSDLQAQKIIRRVKV